LEKTLQTKKVKNYLTENQPISGKFEKK